MTLLYALLLLITTTIATTLNVSINPQQKGNSFYQVFVNDDLWLESGQLEGYFHSKWSSTNTTTVKNEGWDEIMLTATSTKSGDDDFGGQYSEQIFSWQTSTTMIRFDTSFKFYDDGQAVAVTGTNSLPFNVVSNSKYAAQTLGYLTWKNTFSAADYGMAPLATNALAGIIGGPVVLYDNSDHAVLVATNDNFGISTQLNVVPSAGRATATFMYNSQRKDSLLCISSQCYDANGDYGDRDVEGDGFPLDDSPELIALTLWYSTQYNDNYVATSISPPDNTYTISFNNGYIYRNNATNRLALSLYYNQEKQDHATAATQKIKNQLLSQGYVFVAVQGYILYERGVSVF